MSKAKQFVDNFEKAVRVMQDNSPKDLMMCVIVYARSPEEKSEKFPDGDFYIQCVDRTNYYDRATIEQYIKESWRQDRTL